MQHHAVDERLELAHTLRTVGPGRPTLCGDWTTSELAAHLVLRERSVRELAGRVPVAALQRWAESGISDYLAQTGFAAVVDQVEGGPPRWSPWAAPPVREAVNLLEYVVHHEDVRRAETAWPPRPMALARQRAVWSRLRLAAPMTMASVPVGVELRWPSHGTITTRRARHGYPVVAVTGDPVELALVAFGRQRVAAVAFDGEPEDVAALTGARIAV